MPKPSTIQIWLSAARLRTLPLSIAGIITGNALALETNAFSWMLFAGALLTAIAYQILSNFANDYGDGVKGTDNENRIGPKRVMQQKLIEPKVLYNAIIITAIVAFVLSVVLVYAAFGMENLKWIGLFLALSAAAIWAAYNYTVGESAYGYFALGDIFVFLFFGFVAVGGAYFLQTQELTIEVVYWAIAMGGLSVGVLNLNNMRDTENDIQSNKKTIANTLGPSKSIIYQYFLLFISVVSLVISILIYGDFTGLEALPIVIVIPLVIQSLGISKVSNPKDYDTYLKPLALSTFALSLLLLMSKWLAL